MGLTASDKLSPFVRKRWTLKMKSCCPWKCCHCSKESCRRTNIHSRANDAANAGTLLVFLGDILSSVPVVFFRGFPRTNTHTTVATSRVRNASSWPEHLAPRLSKDTANKQSGVSDAPVGFQEISEVWSWIWKKKKEKKNGVSLLHSEKINLLEVGFLPSSGNFYRLKTGGCN